MIMKRFCAPSFIVLAALACGTSGPAEPLATGGAPGSGGAMPTGGRATGGVNAGTGGATGPATGGTTGSGGAGQNATGASATGGRTGTGGAAITGGAASVGGAAGGGGKAGGGIGTTGGGPGLGGSSGGRGPCDIYAAGNTACVAAHSTVRALYGAYAGNLYQVRRASDKTTKNIPVLAPGGFADAAAQDAFCMATTCTISVIYDQSPNGNDLTVAPAGGWLNNGGLEANATAAKIKVGGHTVYGVYTTSNFDNNVGAVGYRNNKAKNVPKGDLPESIYMVASGKHYNTYCCFDYGNAETNNKDNGKGTMEALYFGSSTQWGRGSGTGPWVMADLEDGVYAGSSFAAPASNTSLVADYVTAMLKGKAGGFTLKGGDAQVRALKTMFDGVRPSGGYDPMRKEGAIVLGVGGDNSHTGEGTFFEGCMTAGYADDTTDAAVQANIVEAGYGH